jgi:hypothetical protein
MDHRPEGFARFGEMPSERAAAVATTLHDADALQLLQTLREEGLGHQRHAAAYVVEACAAGEQLVDDQRRPPLGDDLSGFGDGAELMVVHHAAISWHITDHHTAPGRRGCSRFRTSCGP